MHSLAIVGLLWSGLMALSWAATTQPPPLIRTLSAGGDIGPQFKLNQDTDKPKEPEGKSLSKETTHLMTIERAKP